MPTEEGRRVQLGRERLRELMDEQGLSQRSLAFKIVELGSTSSDQRRTISAILKGKRYLTARSAGYFAAALGVQTGYLLGVTEDRHEANDAGAGSATGQVTPASVPGKLPPEPDLVGREGLLDALKVRLLADGRSDRFALQGIPGVGKTAVALKLAYDAEVREYFSGGILWCGFGRDGNVLTELGAWAMQVGIPRDALTQLTTIRQRASAITDKIGERRMLLVVDDVWEAVAAAGFVVGGANCVHIATTRSPDVASRCTDPQNVMRVEELSEDDGLKLLARLADLPPEATKDDPEVLRELAREVGFLPLALMLMGNHLRRLASRGELGRVRNELNRLRDRVARFELQEAQAPRDRHPSLPDDTPLSLKAAIALSVEALPDEEARLALFSLSVFPAKPNTFSEEAAMAVAACTAETLYALGDSGVLEDAGGERCALHKTVADYATEELVEDAPWQRMAEHYCEYLRGHQGDYRAMESEMQNVATAIRGAVDREATSAVELALQSFEFLEGLGLSEQAFEATELARGAVRAQGGTGALPLLLRNLGRLARNRGDSESARRMFQEGLALAEEHGERAAQAVLHRGIGATYLDVADYLTAKGHFLTGLGLARETGDTTTSRTLLANLLAACLQAGEFEEAERYFEECLPLSDQPGEIGTTLQVLQNIASLRMQRGDLAAMAEHVDEAVQLAERTGRRQTAMLLQMSAGTVALQQGKYDAAESYYRAVEERAEATGYLNRQTAIGLSQNWATLCVRLGHFGEAERHAKRGLQGAEEIGYLDAACTLASTLGTIEACRKNFAESQERYRTALERALKLGKPWLVGGVLVEWGKAYFMQGRWDDGGTCFREVLEIATEHDHGEYRAEALFGLAKVAAAHGREQEAQTRAQEALEVFEDLGHRDVEEVREWLDGLPDSAGYPE